MPETNQIETASLGNIETFFLIEPEQQITGKYLSSLADELYVEQRHIVLHTHASKDLQPVNQAKPCSIEPLITGLLGCLRFKIPLLLVRDQAVSLPEQMPSGAVVGVQTSGTTGAPKWAFHPIQDLLARVQTLSTEHTWLLSYHPFSFAGLQVVLHALVAEDALVYSAEEPTLDLAIQAGVTALSMTPSYFRLCALQHNFTQLAIQRITFGGEICDQITLDTALKLFSNAHVRHIYATTELGSIFSVKDGLAGFPQDYLSQLHHGWSLQIQEDELVFEHAHKTIHTGDLVEHIGERVCFVGRRDNVINVGGEKVNLDQLEQSLLALPDIADARVYAQPNPLTQYLVGVELVAHDAREAQIQYDHWLAQQPRAAKPRFVHWVSQVSLASSTKKDRSTPCVTS